MTPAKSTLDKLRRLYFTTWYREWPHDNTFLTELWTDAREFHNSTVARIPPSHVWEHCLVLMRESHEFTPARGHTPNDQ